MTTSENMMDEQLIRILYNIVCLMLSLTMIKGTHDKLYKAIGLLFVCHFILLISGSLGNRTAWAYAIMIATVAYVLLLIKILRAPDVKPIDKVLLTIFPSATILKLYVGALQLPYFTEAKFISVLTLVIVIFHYLYTRFIQKDAQRQREAFETNGLFAATLLATLVR